MNIVDKVQQAVKYTSEKKFTRAKEIYLSILEQDSENAIVLSLLGLLCLNMRKYKPAKKYLTKSYDIKELDSTAEGLGLVNYHLKDENSAEEYFAKVIDKTKNFDVYDKYIKILLEKRNFKLANTISEQGYKKFPFTPDALAHFVYTCINVGRLQEAYSHATQLIKIHPNFGIGWNLFGLINEVLYQDENFAKKCYQKALKCGDVKDAYYNLAINASRNKDFNTAIKYVKKLYPHSADIGQLNFTMSTIYFKQRKFKQAYKYYIDKNTNFEKGNPIFKLKNLWDGKAYKKENLLVFGDQGIGDILMFSRYLPFLENKFAKIKVFVKDSVYKLLKRSFKNNKKIEFYVYKGRFPKYDKSVVMSNLPYYLKMWLEDIPYGSGYLSCDKNIAEKYGSIINSNKLKIGICWEAGGVGLRDLLQRTLNINMFEPFFNVPNTQFYSLQVKPSMDNYKDYKELVDLGQDFKDFDDTAGAISNLDLVITVDTSVAHLAGALGIRTFLILPYSTDWRWFDSTKTTEWYDSITIFKQSVSNSWKDVFDNITYELKKLKK